MSSFAYLAPHTLNEVVSTLANNPEARALAGGHLLLLDANRKNIDGALLVDLGKIDSLVGITKQSGGSVRLGAMTTIAALAESGLIREEYPALAEAAQLIGDAQVRNRATLGGNLAAADPEADLPAVLLALDATIQLSGAKGSRTVPVDQFFTGPLRTALKRDEVITSVDLPAVPRHSGMAYEKFKHPATLYAICGVSASVVKTQDGKSIESARIGVTGALDHPARSTAVENAIANTPATEESIRRIASSSQEPLTFRNDLFGSADYRRHLMNVLTGRALKRALDRVDS